jgi:hypothetical protein
MPIGTRVISLLNLPCSICRSVRTSNRIPRKQAMRSHQLNAVRDVGGSPGPSSKVSFAFDLPDCQWKWAFWKRWLLSMSGVPGNFCASERHKKRHERSWYGTRQEVST